MMNGAGARGGNSSNDSANMLKPALGKGDIQVVRPTWEEYRKYFEKDLALMRRFQESQLMNPIRKLQKIFLLESKSITKNFPTQQLIQDAIDEAIKLSVKYIPDKKLPDKAIDLVDLACSKI